MSFCFNPIWQQPGADDRLKHLWTVERLSLNATASRLTTEFGVRVSHHGVGKKLARMGLSRFTRSAVPAPEIERTTAITLPGGYAYAGGRLLPPSENPERPR